MISETLDQIEAAKKAAIEEMKVKAGSAEKDKASRTAALVAAEKELEVGKASEKEKASALQACTALVSAKKKASKAATKEQENGDKPVKDLRAREAVLVNAKASLDSAGVADSAVTMEKNRAAAFVKSVGKSYVFDDLLLKQLQRILSTAGKDHTEFDKIVTKNVDSALVDAAKDLQVQIEVHGAAMGEREASVGTASTELQAASDAETAAKASFKEAEAAVEAATQAVKIAKKAVSSFYRDTKQVMDGLDKQQKELDFFVGTSRVYFEELKERVAPPPEPEKTEEVTEAVPEEAAVAPEATAE